jgi:hypothetical protein
VREHFPAVAALLRSDREARPLRVERDDEGELARVWIERKGALAFETCGAEQRAISTQ